MRRYGTMDGLSVMLHEPGDLVWTVDEHSELEVWRVQPDGSLALNDPGDDPENAETSARVEGKGRLG